MRFCVGFGRSSYRNKVQPLPRLGLRDGLFSLVSGGTKWGNVSRVLDMRASGQEERIRVAVASRNDVNETTRTRFSFRIGGAGY